MTLEQFLQEWVQLAPCVARNGQGWTVSATLAGENYRGFRLELFGNGDSIEAAVLDLQTNASLLIEGLLPVFHHIKAGLDRRVEEEGALHRQLDAVRRSALQKGAVNALLRDGDRLVQIYVGAAKTAIESQTLEGTLEATMIGAAAVASMEEKFDCDS